MSVARCREIDAWLRAAGITVREASGRQSRGNGQTSAYEGGLVHHTATGYGIAVPGTGAGNLLTNGRPDLRGPLCDYAGNDDGSITVIAAHPETKTVLEDDDTSLDDRLPPVTLADGTAYPSRCGTAVRARAADPRQRLRGRWVDAAPDRPVHHPHPGDGHDQGRAVRAAARGRQARDRGRRGHRRGSN